MTEGLQKGVKGVRIETRNNYSDVVEKVRRSTTKEGFSETLNQRLQTDILNNGITNVFRRTKIEPTYLNYTKHGMIMLKSDIETENYKITQNQESGSIRVYDKKADAAVGINSLDDLVIQTDAATGTKLLINNLGGGFYCMVQVSEELEGALKKALNTDSLKETELFGFQIHTDQKSGIKYITANGYESRGGLLILDDAGREKLTSLANEYMEQYPNLVNSIEEAFIYAGLEISGIVKRTGNGILILGPNSVYFYNANGVDRWGFIFDKEDYDGIRKDWDSQNNRFRWESKEFWKKYLKEKSIKYEDLENISERNI